MSFGNGYEPKEYDEIVPEGDYTVRLGMPEDIQRGQYSIRDIPIAIKGYPGFSPAKWSIFDAPNEPDRMDKWNKAMTRNADAFGVQRGDFRPASWAGKVGRVHIGKDARGYMQVKWSIPPDAVPETPKPAPAAPKQFGAPPPQPANAVPPADDGFEDEIPFDGGLFR
jgi:hypothetical protein